MINASVLILVILNNILSLDTTKTLDTKVDSIFAGGMFNFNIMPVSPSCNKCNFSENIPVNVSIYSAEVGVYCAWKEKYTQIFTLLLGYDMIEGSKQIQNIYGYNAYSEIAVKAFSIGAGISLPYMFKKNFYFRGGVCIKKGIAGNYSLNVKIIRNQEEVILYERNVLFNTGIIEGKISVDYKFSPREVFFINVIISDYLINDIDNYKAPVGYVAGCSITNLGFGIGIKKEFFNWNSKKGNN